MGEKACVERGPYGMVCIEGGKLPSILFLFVVLVNFTRLRIGVNSEDTSFHGACTPGTWVLDWWYRCGGVCYDLSSHDNGYVICLSVVFFVSLYDYILISSNLYASTDLRLFYVYQKFQLNFEYLVILYLEGELYQFLKILLTRTWLIVYKQKKFCSTQIIIS